MKPEVIVIVIAAVGDTPVKVGTLRLQGIDTLRRTLHGSTLSSANSADQFFIPIVNIDDVWTFLSYPYDLSGVDKAPSSLRDMTISDFYMWYSRFMMESVLPKDARSPGIHIDVDSVDDSVSAADD